MHDLANGRKSFVTNHCADRSSLEYVQVAHPFEQLTFEDEPVNVPRSGGAKGFDLRWHCRCVLPGDLGSFPPLQQGDGITMASPPAFAKKQHAKHSAAQAACQHLIDEGLMTSSGVALRGLKVAPRKEVPPSTGAEATHDPSAGAPAPTTVGEAEATPDLDVGSSQETQQQGQTTTGTPGTPDLPLSDFDAPSKPASPVQPQRRSFLFRGIIPGPHNKSLSSDIVTAADTSDTNSSAPHSPSPATEEAPSSPRTDGTSATLAVATLSKHLKLPVPRYIIGLADPYGKPNSWSGRPDFNGDPRFPVGLGVVRDGLTEKAAMEEMAEAVPEFLEGVQAEREKKSRQLFWAQRRSKATGYVEQQVTDRGDEVDSWP